MADDHHDDVGSGTGTRLPSGTDPVQVPDGDLHEGAEPAFPVLPVPGIGGAGHSGVMGPGIPTV